MRIAAFLTLGPVLAGLACLRTESAVPDGAPTPAPAAAVPAPAAAAHGEQVITEPSVLRGFDAAAPLASERMLRTGGMSGSRIVFEVTRVELGDLYQYERRSFEFPFRVEGADPARITVVDANCGCTDARISADWLKAEGDDPAAEVRYLLGDEIPAGARGRLIGTFDAERKWGDKLTTITVRGSFDNTPLKLELHTFLRQVFAITPAQVRFGDVLAGPAGGSPTVDVRLVAKAPFQVEQWRKIPPGVRVEPIGEQTPTGERGEVAQTWRITLCPDAPEGMLQSSAIAATSLGHDLEFMVIANVTGPVRCTPAQRLIFGVWDQGEARDRTLDIESVSPGLKLPLPAVVAEGDVAKYLLIEVETVEADRFYRVHATLPADAPVGSHSGVLRLKFPEGSGLPDRQFVVSGRIREKR